MSTHTSILRSLVLGSALLAAPAFAGDWYVDGVNGSNANGGTSPTDAWRTITWAVAHAPALQGETIHVAQGIYDTALGEQFPIVVRSGQRIVGTSNPFDVGVKGAPLTPALFVFQSSGLSDVYSPASGLENMYLDSGKRGVVITSTDGVMSPTLRSLTIHTTSDFALVFESSSAIRASPLFEGVSAVGPGPGVLCNSTGTQAQFARFHDCWFVSSTAGLTVRGAFDVSLERSTFRYAGTHGLALRAPGAGLLQTVTVRDAPFIEIGRNAVEFSGNGLGTSNLTLERCTLAGSQAASIRVSGLQNTNVSIFDSILAGPAGDIALDPGVNAQVLASNSLIRDGFSSGINGCFSADPLFHDPGSIDFSLAFGSPCIDRGTAAPIGSPAIDGDFDLFAAPDLGAYEFQPLVGYAEVSTHTTLNVSLSGPPGGAAVVKWSRQPLLGNPISTSFGQLYLPVPHSNFATLPTFGAMPAFLSREVVTTPELIGQTFSFQALVDSPASPTGKAYSNPLQLTIAYN